jgi:hypothetical protein
MKLFLCFSFSAAFHSAGGTFVTWRELAEFRYFLLQAVAITAGDGVIWLRKYLGWIGGILGRIFGYKKLIICMS